MKGLLTKHLSVLGVALIAAAAIVTVIVPGKAKGDAANDGTLRDFSATAQGVDQDAAQAIKSCIPDVDTSYSCSFTFASGTTTGMGTSRDGFGGRNTIGNTSITADTPGEQTSVIG